MTYIATSRVNGKGDYAPYQAQKITKDLGGKWHGRYGTVCCPCHDDKNPSLQISDADDGSLIVHCHGGCDWKVIKDELKRRGLYDDGFANGGGNVVQMPVPSAAISAIVSEYPYTDQDGKVLYQVVRYTNKQFRQRCPDGNGGWIWRGPKTAVPYRLPNLIENADQPILIAEGEKDVDNLAALGFTATCNHGGAGKWYSELTPWFKDRRVFILVDNDDAGEKHQALVGAALKVAAEVRVVRFPELPPKGDVSDYLELRLKDGATTDEIKQDLTRRFREAPAWEPASEAIGPNGTNGTEIEWPAPDLSILDFKELSAPAFPSEVFGTFWSQWIEAQAEAKSCPQDYVGLGLIGGSSALIGNARRASPWKGWTEALPVWICEVGKPSSGKSPGLDAVRAELADIEDIANKDYENLRLQWDTKKRIAKAKLDVWESDCRAALKEKKDTPSRPVDADEPERVTRKRIVTNDPTTEKVARLVVENPKGIVLFRDELSGWVGSLNKYGGNGGDRAFYLEAYGGRPYAVDRIKDPEPIVIKSLCLTIIGGIQPDRLATLIFSGDDDGLAARFLYTWPERVPLKIPNTEVPGGAIEKLTRLFDLSLDENGDSIVLPFSKEAAAELQQYRLKVAAAEDAASGLCLSWLGKLPGMAVRLATVLEHLHWCGERPSEAPPTGISKASVERAVKFLNEYAAPMALRCFGEASLPQVDQDARVIARWIVAQDTLPDTINARDLRHTGVLTTKEAERYDAALAELASAGWVRADPGRDGDKGGRQRKDWAVNRALGDAHE